MGLAGVTTPVPSVNDSRGIASVLSLRARFATRARAASSTEMKATVKATTMDASGTP